MATLYMMVGISGSGKSTWAKNNNCKVFSSDEYREKLFGDVNIQSKNGELFNILHKDIKDALAKGEDVCYDATNLSRKDRQSFLDYIKHVPNVNKVAVLIETPIDISLINNDNRDRKVPNNVIMHQVKKFELPILGEGFNSIQRVTWDKPFTKLSIKDIREKMDVYSQNNPHHTLTVGKHCDACYNQLKNSDDINFKVASIIHDIGKLYTESKDEKGISHYYNHENVGAYLALFADYSTLEEQFGAKINPYEVALFINYHMLPFRLKNANDKTKELYIKQFGTYWDNILKLHEADISAK